MDKKQLIKCPRNLRPLCRYADRCWNVNCAYRHKGDALKDVSSQVPNTDAEEQKKLIEVFQKPDCFSRGIKENVPQNSNFQSKFTKINKNPKDERAKELEERKRKINHEIMKLKKIEKDLYERKAKKVNKNPQLHEKVKLLEEKKRKIDADIKKLKEMENNLTERKAKKVSKNPQLDERILLEEKKRKIDEEITKLKEMEKDLTERKAKKVTNTANIDGEEKKDKKRSESEEKKKLVEVFQKPDCFSRVNKNPKDEERVKFLEEKKRKIDYELTKLKEIEKDLYERKAEKVNKNPKDEAREKVLEERKRKIYEEISKLKEMEKDLTERKDKKKVPNTAHIDAEERKKLVEVLQKPDCFSRVNKNLQLDQKVKLLEEKKRKIDAEIKKLKEMENNLTERKAKKVNKNPKDEAREKVLEERKIDQEISKLKEMEKDLTERKAKKS